MPISDDNACIKAQQLFIEKMFLDGLLRGEEIFTLCEIDIVREFGRFDIEAILYCLGDGWSQSFSGSFEVVFMRNIGAAEALAQIAERIDRLPRRSIQ